MSIDRPSQQFPGFSYTKHEAHLNEALTLAKLQDFPGQRVAVVRTSDRNLFKQCRRKWAWQSHMKQNREPLQQASPLWFGTGIHYALEDAHGYNQYQTPLLAFEDYIRATARQNRQQLPDDWKDLVEMGNAMLDYYYNCWLKNRSPLRTLVINGVPQVEVNFIIDLPFDLAARGYDGPQGYDKVVYAGTIDRVTVDDDGQIWLVDYKTAKALKQSHFANDPQVSAYCWAASRIYSQPVAGLIYWQFRKCSPTPPEPMVSGKISTNKAQVTSHSLYRRALMDKYGKTEFFPAENMAFLNTLTAMESEDQDPFIRRDKIHKNSRSHESEGQKIMMELEDILNPNLPLYPNPTFLCPSICSFYEACVSMDDGSDWQDQIEMETQLRAQSNESWRKFLQGGEAMAEGLKLPTTPTTTKDFE